MEPALTGDPKSIAGAKVAALLPPPMGLVSVSLDGIGTLSGDVADELGKSNCAKPPRACKFHSIDAGLLNGWIGRDTRDRHAEGGSALVMVASEIELLLMLGGGDAFASGVGDLGDAAIDEAVYCVDVPPPM